MHNFVRSCDVHVQEAALTGESLPVEKHAPFSASTAQSAEQEAGIFLGTSVISGTGSATLMAADGAIAFGDIACRLATKRAYGDAPYNHGKNVTLLAAFEAYVEETICLALRDGQIVLMDNFMAHKGIRVRELLEARQ